jgi:hypothetical protein
MLMSFKSPNRILSLHFNIILPTAALFKFFAKAIQQICFQIWNRNLSTQLSELQRQKILYKQFTYKQRRNITKFNRSLQILKSVSRNYFVLIKAYSLFLSFI